MNLLRSITVAALVLPAHAFAEFSPVNEAFGPFTKWALDGSYFGGADTFSPSSTGGAVYTGGGLTATRVDDFGVGGTANIDTSLPGTASDQLWIGGPCHVSVLYREAVFQGSFGYEVAGSGTPVELVTLSPGDSATVLDPPGGPWSWRITLFGPTA